MGPQGHKKSPKESLGVSLQRERGKDSCTSDQPAVLGQAFGVYGPLRRVWVTQKPPGFAFVAVEKPHDAAAAVQGLNGKTLCGRQIRVEFSIRQKRRKHINMHELAPASWN
uniref:RRM domain-containing protein n=1 Tax=Xenopus tropicalis TaxID=8364 RepID=A0A803K0U5_XENTR